MSNFPFRNVSKVGQPLVSDQIESNLAIYLQWNLLGVNAFGNNTYNTSGNYGGNASRLRLSDNPNYSAGRVWEGFRKQWIWQSGIYAEVQPIQVSGVKVNGTFYPLNTSGSFAHKIDYANGRVVFNSSIATNSTVLVEHAYHYYQIYTADNPNWTEWQRNSFRFDDSEFLMTASGAWSAFPEQKVQLPAIIIEVTPNFTKVPFNLGSHTHWHRQEVKLHIITENRKDLKWGVDVLGGQYDTVLNMFDKARMVASGVYPVNMIDGSINSVIRNYPDILLNFPLNREMRLMEFRSYDNSAAMNTKTIPFYFTTMRMVVETLLN